MAMAKTPRRSLRSYLRSAPVVLAQYHDTEILADVEAMEHPTDAALRRMGQFSERYAMGKLPKPTLLQRIAAVFDRVFWTVFIGGFLLALASMVLLIISGHFGWW